MEIETESPAWETYGTDMLQKKRALWLKHSVMSTAQMTLYKL